MPPMNENNAAFDADGQSSAAKGFAARHQGQLARQQIHYKYGLIEGNNKQHYLASRAQRFAHRMANVDKAEISDCPSAFAALANLPIWALDDKIDREQLGWATGLLYYRPILDQQLDGSTLRNLASLCGESLLDIVLECFSPFIEFCADKSASMPASEDILSVGQTIMEQAAQSDDNLITGLLASSDAARRLCDFALQLLIQFDETEGDC